MIGAGMVAATVRSTSTPSSVVISNVIYVVGAVVLAAVAVAVIVLRHRRPVSVQSNMDTFHRGLAALAPGAPAARRRPAGQAARPPAPAGDDRSRAVGTVRPVARGPVPPRPRSGADVG